MKQVLILCTGNSCRSQMAEGWARALRSEQIDALSAGIEKHGLNPNAVAVMAEAGVDITSQTSNTLDEIAEVPDVVVTVCASADESCPTFPGATRIIHHGFDDPPKLAKEAATEEEALSHYRRVRDEIKSFVETLPEAWAIALSQDPEIQASRWKSSAAQRGYRAARAERLPSVF